MHPELIIAGLIGALVTAMATVAIGIATLLYNQSASKRSAFINTVTSERVKWIEKVRKNIAALIALCERRSRTSSGTELEEIHRMIDPLQYEIRLQLNPIEDQTIEEMLNRLPSHTRSPYADELRDLLNELTRATQQLLKREWEKAKKESVKGDLQEKTGWERFKEGSERLLLVMFPSHNKKLREIEQRLKRLEDAQA